MIYAQFKVLVRFVCLALALAIASITTTVKAQDLTPISIADMLAGPVVLLPATGGSPAITATATVVTTGTGEPLGDHGGVGSVSPLGGAIANPPVGFNDAAGQVIGALDDVTALH